jgi:hypothetical protein
MSVDFARAREPGDADADRPAGIGQQLLKQRVCLGIMVGALRFNERHRAPQRGPLAGPDARGEIFYEVVSPHGLAARSGSSHSAASWA